MRQHEPFKYMNCYHSINTLINAEDQCAQTSLEELPGRYVYIWIGSSFPYLKTPPEHKRDCTKTHVGDIKPFVVPHISSFREIIAFVIKPTHPGQVPTSGKCTLTLLIRQCVEICLSYLIVIYPSL